MGHYFLGKKNLLLMAGSLISTLAVFVSDKATKKYRPAAVGVLKEGYAFKEWVAGNFEKVREDVEDMVAEAVYEYQGELDAAADMAKREKELLENIEKIVGKKLAEMEPEKKEA